MKNKEIFSADELNNSLIDVINNTKKSIVNLMKSHHIKSLNFELDDKGRDRDDDEYNMDYVFDNRVWVDCYGKYSNEVGYLSEVSLGNNDEIILTAEGEDGTYIDDYVSHTIDNYLDILYYIELFLKKVA